MHKLWAAALALLSALAFLIVGSPPASAFGTEVLGCSIDSGAWYANSCEGGGDGAAHTIYFSPHNLSGSYTTSWTVTKNGNAMSNCGSSGSDCISAGCTSGALVCYINAFSGLHDKTFAATLKLTQSGQTRTISASALIDYDSSTCLRC